VYNKITLPIVFPHVFNNEFNSRTILKIEDDHDFGSQCLNAYISSSRAYFDLMSYGNRSISIYNEKCDYNKNLKAKLVYTVDKNGVNELFRFWMYDNKNCYSQLNDYCKSKFETKFLA